MLKKLTLTTGLLAICVSMSGCVTGKGLIPDKDVEITNAVITIMTPYGQQTLRADRIATRHNPSGTPNPSNTLPPLVPNEEPQK